MSFRFTDRNSFLRDFLVIETGLAGWYLFDNIHHRDTLFFAFSGIFFVCLLLTIKLYTSKIEECKIDWHQDPLQWYEILGGVLVIGLIVAFFLIDSDFLAKRAIRLFLFVSLSGGLSLLYGRLNRKRSSYLFFAGLLLLVGVVYRLGLYVPYFQSTPFTIFWSEGSRYYWSSTFISQTLYGVKLPWPIIDQAGAILQLFPFFFWPENILLHRIWLVILWVGLTAWMAWLFTRRVKHNLKTSPLWLSIFFFLFFFQGAVYFHLIPIIILTLIAYDPDKKLRNVIFMLIASVWAGISRINWLPVPSLLLSMLYILDTPLRKRNKNIYLLTPILWTMAGVAVATLSKLIYIRLSGEDPEFFSTHIFSSLLWYRLFPNTTFNIGIILAIILLCLPLGISFSEAWRLGLKEKLAPTRWIGIFSILIVFLLGGMVVSTKIGGGSDLHNLDAFIVLFALAGGSLLAGAYVPEVVVQQTKPIRLIPLWLLGIVLIPVFFSFQMAPRWRFQAPTNAMEQVSRLNQALEVVKKADGEVLFISNRQLQIFKMVPDFDLVHDYELGYLMEMSISRNQKYLDKFRSDLQSHKFTVILIDQLNTQHQDKQHSFGEENNAWVDEVLLPLLDYYQPAFSVDGGNVNLLVAKSQPELIAELKALQD
ncbi:MAG TPA: hypothetical protein VLR89_02190 [Anaerolineaceae bacterium]|nr:hypothetical protein [Anaerolineaceae bacterium]